jgi:hypothetical protein
VTPILWGSERFWPVLHEANDLPTGDREKRDWLGGLRSVRDANLSDDFASRCNEAIDPELPAARGWVLGIHSSEVLCTTDALLGLRPVDDELLRKHGLDGEKSRWLP